MAHSSNEWMCRFDEWTVAFHRIVSFIKNTLEHAPVSQLSATANRSHLSLLVQELWLIKLSQQPTLPGRVFDEKLLRWIAASMKSCSTPFVSWEENEVLWIWLQGPSGSARWWGEINPWAGQAEEASGDWEGGAPGANVIKLFTAVSYDFS